MPKVKITIPEVLPYDKTSASSIFEYSKGILGNTLRDFMWEGYVRREGKGGLGQMVENIYFFLETNSNPASDFSEAGLELKTTPLKTGTKKSHLIKERLSCGMINYFDVVEEDFEHSHFYLKCRLMLLLFYLYEKGCDNLDLKFIFSVLWKLPDKDLLIIKHDYEVIREKVKRGEAHLLSEGDTEYLGACRKGQKGESPVAQPNSAELAPRRVFSLKPAYMRTVLEFILKHGKRAVANYDYKVKTAQVVSSAELRELGFEEIILNKLNQHIGKDYLQLCEAVGRRFDTDKGKYAHITSRLINPKSGNVNLSEEFKKAGLQLKTIRIEEDGGINEAMSFENIDYREVIEAEDWYDSRLYEIFSGRFLFAVFKADGGTITYTNNRGKVVTENTYSFADAFFWTMPLDDLDLAEDYWLHIRKTVKENHIDPSFFNSESNPRFHVRPKGKNSADLAENPNGGYAKKYCYWFNNSYVKEIIKKHG